MIERSYVMIKPGFANDQSVINEVIKRLENAGLKIVASAYIKYDGEAIRKHYDNIIKEKPDVFPKLAEYMTSGSAYGMVVEGENAITRIRELVGKTYNPAPGTIRYDIPKMLGREPDLTKNVVHASDSPKSSKHEIRIFSELLLKKISSYKKEISKHTDKTKNTVKEDKTK